MKNIFRISGVILSIFLLFSCKKDKPTPPTVKTTSITTITYTTAISGGEVTDDGHDPLISCGVCWHTSPGPTVSNSKTSEGGKTGTFISNITLLTPNTLYYVKAYAANSIGISYGNEISFTTSTITLATLTTIPITSLTQVSAVSGGNISNDNGGTITGRGVCWSTISNPTTSDNKTTDGSGTGSYTSLITGLLPITTYYLRSYAINSAGTVYGEQINFKTLAGLPIITTSTVNGVEATNASCGGNITSDGGAQVTARGVCWSTTTNPITSNNKTIDGDGIGIFTSSISGLSSNTAYFVRAYATNSTGTAYGNETSFTTLGSPGISSTAISSVTLNSAISGGSVTSDRGATVTVRGVCWSTSTNPTITNSKTEDGSGLGNFTSSLLGLSGNTTYYLKAYATNSVGTSYGTELVFKTYTGTVSDLDGNVYNTITIGSQIWMAENLRTTTNRSNSIPTATFPGSATLYSTRPQYQWAYNNDESNVATYGRLYTVYAVIGGYNACPTGWHVPSDSEWNTLSDYLISNSYGYGGSGDDISKSLASPFGWVISNTIGYVGNDQASNNKSGFSALPGGKRHEAGGFEEVGNSGIWWSSSLSANQEIATTRTISNNNYNTLIKSSNAGWAGLSVRCVKD